MAFATKYGPANLRLERYLVVLAAMIANDLEALRSFFTFCGLFRTALCTALWRHHVPLVKDLLFFFGEKEGLFTLNARGLDVRHILFS